MRVSVLWFCVWPMFVLHMPWQSCDDMTVTSQRPSVLVDAMPEGIARAKNARARLRNRDRAASGLHDEATLGQAMRRGLRRNCCKRCVQLRLLHLSHPILVTTG